MNMEVLDLLNKSNAENSVGSGSLEEKPFRRHSTGSNTKAMKAYGHHKPPTSILGRKGQKKNIVKLPSTHSMYISPLSPEHLDVVKALFLKFTKSDIRGASHMNSAGIRDLCASTNLISNELEYKIDFDYQKPTVNYSGKDDEYDGLWQIELVKKTDIDMIYKSIIKTQKSKDLNFERFYLTLKQIACKCYEKEIDAFVSKKFQKIANEINLNIPNETGASELVNHLNANNMDLDRSIYNYLYDEDKQKEFKEEAAALAFAKLIKDHLQPTLKDLQLLQGYSTRSSTPKSQEPGYTYTMDSPTDSKEEGFRTPSNRSLFKEVEIEDGLIKDQELHYLNLLFRSYGESEVSENGINYFMNFVSVHQLLVDLQLTPKSIDFAQVYLAFVSCCKFDFYEDFSNDLEKSASSGVSSSRGNSAKRKRKNKIDQYRRNIWSGDSYQVYGLFDFASFQMFMIQIAPHIFNIPPPGSPLYRAQQNHLIDTKNYNYETCVEALLRHIVSVPQNKLTKSPYISGKYTSRKSSTPSLSFKL